MFSSPSILYNSFINSLSYTISTQTLTSPSSSFFSNTNVSFIPSTLFSNVSISSGNTFFPLFNTITLFFLPEIYINPSLSILAKSPVWNHPSDSNADFVASSFS